MRNFKEKILDLVDIGIFLAAVFGVGMFCAYILCLFIPERDHIPMEAIGQLLFYIVVFGIGIIVFLSDIVFEHMKEEKRIMLFFLTIYIVGMCYFQVIAPHGPLDGFIYFFGFSFFLGSMGAIFTAGWYAYQTTINRKYNACLNNYKQRLDS